MKAKPLIKVNAVFFVSVFLILFMPQQILAQVYCTPTYSPQGNSWMITEFAIPEVVYSYSIGSYTQTDNTDEMIMLSTDEEYTFEITTVGWVGVGVAIDFNSDGDFEDDGEIVVEPTYTAQNPATYSYSITIPASTPDDSYRLRLWNALANAGDGNPVGSPCGTYSYGTYADFTLVIGDCFPPVNIEVSDISQNEATVTWMDNGIAELWNVEYGESGFEQGEGTIISGIDEMTYTIEDLSTDTEYDVYVQSDCESDGLSGWTGPVGFATHFNSEPIEIIGFSDDVIANGVGPMAESTTNIVDSDSFCFLSEDWKLNEGDPDITVGLPEDGIITSSEFPELTYQMSPFDTPYEGNNSLRLENIDDVGTLELAEPNRYGGLFFLTTSGSGSSTVEIVVTFDDGSSQLFMSQAIPDWYQTGSIPVELSGFGRGDISNDNVETPANNPKLFRLTVDIDDININKLVTEIDVKKVGGSGVVNIFAVSGKLVAECQAPTDFSIDEITQTTIEFSWTEPDNVANIDGYGWVVVMPGDIPFEDDHVAEGMADVGETSAVVSNLIPDTAYDVYFVSICDLDNMFFSEFAFETVTTESLGVNNELFSGLTFYPNPVDNNLYLQAQEPLQNVSVFNLRGQNVFSTEGSLNNNEMTIQLGDITAGVYIMKVTISGTTKTFKLLKK